MRFKNAYAFAIICVFCAGALFAYVSTDRGPQVKSVTLTESGFEPSRILIKKGDTVVFLSEIDGAFWPASDSHPTHGKYSEFDPGRPISQGESWSFTFEKAGVWMFHDHTRPTMNGKVLVQGSDGESAVNCLEVQNGTIQPECWEAEVLSLTRKNGVERAFDSIRIWYRDSPDFRRNCHDVMHIVGVAGYDEFAREGIVTTREEVSYCGYGFYHGFIETMLREQGVGQYVKAHAYCEALRKIRPEAAGPCYHGIGHAVFDSIEGSLWSDDVRMVDFALDVCKAALPGEYERVRCGSGVFNALANAYSTRSYGLSFGDKDPLFICANAPRSYQDFCYMELGNGYVRDKQWNQTQEIEYIRNIDDEDARAAIVVGYMDTEVRRTIDDTDVVALARLCESFERKSDIQACVTGILIGLRGIGEPEREEELIESFCGLFDSEYRVACHEDAP